MSSERGQSIERWVQGVTPSLMEAAASGAGPTILRALLSRLSPPAIGLFEIEELISRDESACVAHESPELEVVLSWWRPGETDRPHDHPGSHGALRVLSGVAVETRYELNDDGLAIECGRERYFPGSVLLFPGEEIRAIGNDTGAMEAVVALQVYCPRSAFRFHERTSSTPHSAEPPSKGTRA